MCHPRKWQLQLHHLSALQVEMDKHTSVGVTRQAKHRCCGRRLQRQLHCEGRLTGVCKLGCLDILVCSMGNSSKSEHKGVPQAMAVAKEVEVRLRTSDAAGDFGKDVARGGESNDKRPPAAHNGCGLKAREGAGLQMLGDPRGSDPLQAPHQHTPLPHPQSPTVQCNQRAEELTSP